MSENIRDLVTSIKQSDLPENDKKTQILTALSKSTYCVVPWLAASTTTMGKFVTCCVDSRDEHTLRRSDGSEYHILDDDAVDSINSQTNVMVREEMLAGKKPDRCMRCYNIEKCDAERSGDTTSTSYRQAMNRKFYDYLEFGAVGTLRHIDFRLGNVCNLKCRMCGPTSSSKWFKELKELQPTSNPTPPTNWQDDDRTIDFVSKCASDLVDVRFAGGEPMLSKQHYKIVDYLIETGLAKNIDLKYNINGTLMPDDLVNKWSEFKSVRLSISIDGVGDLNDYIRYPSDWKVVDANIRKAASLKGKMNLSMILLSAIQIYNIFSLYELKMYSESISTPFSAVPVWSPEFLCVSNLPKSVKEDVMEFYKGSSDANIDRILAVMNLTDGDKWREFVEFTNKTDDYRGQSVTDVIPWVLRFMDNYG